MADKERSKPAPNGGAVASDGSVDAVFVIGTGSTNSNEELRYALRNLDRNCPFIRDVYISGECPAWVDTTVVKHLKWPDRFRHAKDANIIDKLRHACEQPGIAPRILFCSDDQFVTRECTWEDFEPRWLRKYDPADGWYESRNRLWHSRLHKTLDRDRRRRNSLGLDQKAIYYYQPHMWMQIDRDKFIEYAKWSDYEHRDDTIIASGYFNFIDAGGKFNFDHTFISPAQKWPVKTTHVAYTDSSYAAAMKFLRQEFPDPSRFELSGARPKKAGARPEVRERLLERPRESPGAVASPVALERPEESEASPASKSLESFRARVLAEPAWRALRDSLDLADRMREHGYPGWEKVWGDIMTRWRSTTDNGRLRLPVTSPPSAAAALVLDRFRQELSKGHGTEEADPAAPRPVGSVEPAGPVAFVAPVAADEGQGKKCAKCEERRRERELRRQAGKQAGVGAAGQDEAAGCVDCAVDHLSMAIAYLNSDSGRPAPLDIALARGEVRVAAQHLLALKYLEEHGECVRALDSLDTRGSVFTADTFTGILRRTMARQEQRRT